MSPLVLPVVTWRSRTTEVAPMGRVHSVATGAWPHAGMPKEDGIFAVIAHSIGQRRREIGIRMALGARRSNVVLLFLRQGLFVP